MFFLIFVPRANSLLLFCLLCVEFAEHSECLNNLVVPFKVMY